MKTNFKRILTTVILFFIMLFYYGSDVSAAELTDENKDEIKTRIEKAMESDETIVDISDLNILVPMYSDRIGKEYSEIANYCEELCEMYDPYFHMGDAKIRYLSMSPETIPTENADEWGCGENLVKEIYIGYDYYYLNDDGSVKFEQLKADKIAVENGFNYALSLVDDSMSDVEKALILYDYIMTVSNYSTDLIGNENGFDMYKPADYEPISLFRNHVSVCNANAGAYCMLLNQSGIRAIQVDSEDMCHAWVMLEIDGKWYHADPTWDDPNYFNNTYNGNYNNDSWDLGAMGHMYFLKSDSTMKNELEHFNWKLSPIEDVSASDVKKTPKSSDDSTFDTTIIGRNASHGQITHYNYIDGYWYYYDSYTECLMRSKFNLDEEPAKSYSDIKDVQYVFSENDLLYIMTSRKIYEFDPETESLKELFISSSYGKEAIFSEMNIYDATLNFVVAIPKNGNPETLWYTENPQNDIEFVEESYKVAELNNVSIEEPTEETTTEEITTAKVSETTTENATEAIAENVVNDSNASNLFLVIAICLLIIGCIVIATAVIIYARKNKHNLS